MPIKVSDIKKSAIDDAWGNTATAQSPKKKAETKSVAKPATAIDDAWGAVDKKKSGTEDGGTAAPIISPTPSNADLASQLGERINEAVASGKAHPVDEGTNTDTIFGSRKQRNRIKDIPENIKRPFDVAPYEVQIKTSDGTSFNIPKKAVNETFTDPNYVQGLQQRIDNKTATPEDVNAIAAGTGKTANAVTAYLTQGKKVGFAVERMEGQAKAYQTLTNSIVNFNKANGTNYNPIEVLSSADKTAAFLNEIKKQPSKEIKADQLQRIQQPEIDLRERLSGRIVNKLLPTTAGMPLSITKEFSDYISELDDHIVNQAIDEGKKSGATKDQVISRIANLTNPKGVKASMQANLGQIENQVSATVNPMAAAGTAYDAIFGTKEKDDLLNTVKVEAELRYNDAVQNKAVNIISEGILTKDDNKIQEGKAMLDGVDEDAIYKSPALVKQEIARRVSNVIATEGGQLQGTETDNYRIKVLGANTEDYAAAMKELGYLDNPKTRDIAMSMLQHPNVFADASYLGGVGDNFLRPFKELGMSVLDITQFRNAKDLLSDKKKEELFPKEMENTKTLIGDITTRSIFNTTANLAGMTAIAIGTEGLGTELGASVKAAKSLGSYTSFGLPSYDAALKDSYNFIDNDAARTLYATISAITNAEGGRLLDLGKVTRIPGVSEVYAKMATNFTQEDISKKAVKELLDEAKNPYIDFAVKYGKNVTKGAATMAYFNISNNINKLVFGDPTVKTDDILPQAAHAFIDGVAGMSIMGVFGAASDMRNEKNTTYKGFIYNMALNHDSVEDIFKQGLKDGTYTQNEFNQKMQVLNTARVAKNAMDAAQVENNVLLNESQKSVYVANKTAAAVLRNKLENLPPEKEKQKGELKAQIERLDTQNKDVLEGLKFSPTLEPLYDLFEAEKKYNEALSEANGGEGSYDKVETAKADYDKLVNQYFTHANIKRPADTKLSEPIEGLDKQGVPIVENVPPATNVESETKSAEATTPTFEIGKPIIVFHGTTQNFESFDSGKRGSTTHAEDTQFGTFFSDTHEEASKYTKGNGRVIKTELNLKNPLVVDVQKIGGDKIPVIKKAIADGHDGIVFENILTGKNKETGEWNNHTEYIVFDNDAIKILDHNHSETKSTTPTVSGEVLKDLNSTKIALDILESDKPDVYEDLKNKNTLDNYDVVDTKIPDNIENEMFWHEKLIEKALKDNGVYFFKQGSKSSGSTYYTMTLNDGDSFKLRVADHKIKYDADANIEFNENTTPQELLEKLRDELPSDKILKNTSIAEEYHKQKSYKNKTNPALVKAVENAIGREEKNKINTSTVGEIPDVETHESVMKRAKTGEPIEIDALRIQQSDKTNDDIGVFYADKGVIEEYKRRQESGFYGKENENLFKGDVKLKKLKFDNPLVIDSKEEFIKELAENGDKEAREVMPDYKETDPAKLTTTHKTHKEFDTFIAKKAREKGYDGIITPLEYVDLKSESTPTTQKEEQQNISSQSKTTDNEKNSQEGSEESSSQKSGEGGSKEGNEENDVEKPGAAPKEEVVAPLLERVREKRVKNYENSSLDEIKEQALQAPASLNNALKDDALTVDLIAENNKEDIEKEIKYQQQRLEGNPSDKDIEEVDKHIQLLEKGLEQKNNSENKEGEPPSITKEETTTEGEDEFTYINKKDITDAEDLASKFPFGESESWKNSVKKGLEKLAKVAKKGKSLYDAAKIKVSDWAAKIKQDIIDDGKSTFNPSDEEIAQMAYHRTMTNKRIAELEPDLTSPIQAVRDAADVVLSDLEAQRDMVDYVLHNTATTAGRAFNIRQMISKIDNENGLQVKRMDIIRKQKGEPLSEKQEQEIRDIHDEEIKNQKEKDEYAKKKAEKDFEEAVKTEVDRRMKEKGSSSNKAFARTKAGNAIRKLKFPKGGGLKADFTLGSWDLLVEGVAKLVDTGINITEAVHQLIKEGVIAFKTDKDKDAAIDYMDNAAKYNAIDGIRELAEKEKSEMLTKSAVGKNYVNDLVSHYIDKGLRGKEVFAELNKDLKEVFPEITEQQVRDAYLKEGEFALDKKENINKGKTEAKHELRSIAKNETDIADLKEERDLRKREREERDKTDYENKLIAEKKGLVDKKALTERQEQRLGELNKELDRLKQRKEKDAKVNNPKDLNRSDKEKAVLDEIKKEKEDWAKEKKAQRELEVAAKKAQTAATNEAARLKALTEKKERLEKGQRDTAKPSAPKVENPAIEQVKAEIKDADKKLRDAESESNRLNKELQDKKDKLAEHEANIKRAENGLESIKTNRKKSDAKIDTDISDAEKRLQKELNKQGLKLEKGSKAEKEQKQKVADSHNERVDKLTEGIDTKLQDDTLSDSEKSALENSKKILEKSKINPDSKLDIFDAVDKAEKNTELARSELANSEKLADIKKEITQSQIQMGKDKLQTEQDILLQRHKDNLQKKIDENERRLESGEYVEKEPARLKTSDAEAVKLEIKDRETKNKLNAIGKAAQRAAMTKREKFIDTIQSLYVIGLVGRLSTLAKVGVSALTKQPLNTITSQTFGRLGGVVFFKIKNALRGEGNEGWRKEKNRYRAHYGALGKEGMAKLINKGKVNEQKADEAYRNAKDKLEDIGNTHGKDSKQYKEFEKGEFKKAEDKQKQALLDNVTNSLYEWIGGNSWADAAEVFLHSSAKLEQLLGKGEKELWKDKTRKEKIMFVLSTSAATHGVLKNFSARAEFAASFVARLENKMKQGIDISSAEEILKTVNESYIAFQRGKYQEDNAITGGFKAGLEGLQKWAEKHPDYKYAADIMAGALKFKNPIVRTPLNIAREAIVEYVIGVPLAIAKYRKSLHDAKVDANSFDLSGLEMKDHMRKFMDNIPADKADFIYRAFRKGGFGLGIMALTAMGGIKFGGFFNRDEKRRKEGDDLGVNEVEIGGHKLSPLQAKIFEHTSAFFPALLWSNYSRVREENLNSDKGEFTANLDAVIKDFQGMMDQIPIGNEVQNPLQGIQLPLIGPFLSEYAEASDVDAEGNKIKRKPQGNQLEKLWQNFELKIPGLRQNVEEQ